MQVTICPCCGKPIRPKGVIPFSAGPIFWVYGSGFPKSYDISKGIDKRAGAEREVVGQNTSIQFLEKGYNYTGTAKGSGYGNEKKFGFGCNITAPATPEAAQWDGWGTALKPAYEPIIVAMKPLDGGFVDNALKWGVAGLWIEGSRINTIQSDDYGRTAAGKDGIKKAHNGFEGKSFAMGDRVGERAEYKHSNGRWPANVIHDGSGEVLAGFPVTPSSGRNGESGSGEKVGIFGIGSIRQQTYWDSGSAARFFYCAKTSKLERGEGNNHPTVKPLALVQYLVRLTKTPTGGIVFDPFMGSGTTLLAARNEGRQAIGIDISAEYCELAKKRIEATEGQPQQMALTGAL